MAGLAATLNAPDIIDAIAWALAPRGSDGAVCRLAGAGGADLSVAVRAAMPTIPRVVAEPIGDDGVEPPPIAALVIDGIASVTALDKGYAAHGPTGLIGEGIQPYAVIFADAERDELVLARNANGPSLYYARVGGGWVVASEPGALLQGGVGAEPEPSVVRRFIETGLCDDTEHTFFSRIHRVLPGEAVVLSANTRTAVRHSTQWTPDASPTEVAVRDATEGPRAGVLLTPGLTGGAVLGTALSQPGRLRPLPVHTINLTGVDGAAAHAPAVLVALPHGTVRHSRHTVSLEPSEVDRFLAEMGEPGPDLGFFLAWAVARELPGDVDTLVDATQGDTVCLERVADRLLARYGVNLRCPLREAGAPPATMASLVNRTLPTAAARHARADVARTPTAAQVVLALGDDVAAALVHARPWADPEGALAALRRLHAGETAGAEALWRTYLVDRWLDGLGPLAVDTPHEPTGAAPVLAGPRMDGSGEGSFGQGSFGQGTPASVGETGHEEEPVPEPMIDEVTVGGETWLRMPVRTARVRPGDPLGSTTSWYVSNALADLRRHRSYQDTLTGPWFVVLSGKAVAVSQKRVSLLLDVLPGRAARMVAWAARQRMPQLGEAWTAQVAIDHSGLGRVAGSVLLGLPSGPDGDLYPPRPSAVEPADVAVVRAPWRPDEFAATVLTAMRYALPADLLESLAGCAIVSADELGCRMLGYAPGPYADAVPRPQTLLPMVLADNPAGQGDEHTPVVLVLRAPSHPTPPIGRVYSAAGLRNAVYMDE